jgi:enamine deaminase RidA (YjgF/YER057c/UK114 family)
LVETEPVLEKQINEFFKGVEAPSGTIVEVSRLRNGASVEARFLVSTGF